MPRLNKVDPKDDAASKLRQSVNSRKGGAAYKYQYAYESFFNDNLADVSDKVKDLILQYKVIKKDLKIEYEQYGMAGNTEFDTILYNKEMASKTKFRMLGQPIKERQWKK